MGGASLSARDVGLTFAGRGSERQIVDNVDFEVARGEFVCVVGPSGSGKTTLLRMLAGLLKPTTGGVYLDDALVEAPPREAGVVFQDYSRALCPWRSVVRNVELTLEVAGTPRRERRERAMEALGRVHLTDRADDYPRMLSGGMQQRVQIARAIVDMPSVLLMDEPFASLDALTKFHLEDVLLDTWSRLGQTVVFVTHDLDEAVYLADRVIVLCGAPSRVVAEIEVDLPRPRDQVTTRALPEFVDLRTRLLTLIDTGDGDE
jgi:NitT/TauT family transport system ATP-binding protein